MSGNGTCVDPFCYITPINKTVNAVSFGCGEITRPLNKITVSGFKVNKYKQSIKRFTSLQIRQKFYFKLFSDFIPFDIFPDVEYCSFVRNVDRNSYFYGIIKTLKQKVPGLIHKCPYQVCERLTIRFIILISK